MRPNQFQKHERQAVAIIKDLLEPKGFLVWTTRNGHAKLVVHVQRKAYNATYVVPSSPRVRGVQDSYARQFAQRIIRGQ